MDEKYREKALEIDNTNKKNQKKFKKTKDQVLISPIG